MTNKQLAAARRAFNRYPGIYPVKDGETITPKRDSDGAMGEPLLVTDNLSEADIERRLLQSIVGMGS